jgi:hypothetical protein
MAFLPDAPQSADGFDLGFIVIYLTYLTFRIYGLKHDEQWAKDFSTDVLAIGSSLFPPESLDSNTDISHRCVGAVGMFPRLAFVTLSNNLMILSLRSMMGEFISAQLLTIAALKHLLTFERSPVLMGIAMFCFLGFSYALWTLGRGRYVPSQPVSQFPLTNSLALLDINSHRSVGISLRLVYSSETVSASVTDWRLIGLLWLGCFRFRSRP